ncbi:glycine oxidase ThiO [Singulisphaera sp. PoT]|uniref:glycine oxidase ThiO n=1 Tax=Singulisphaera sp. PoT TaxID=3411797 RepID=UPI003BF529E2
MNSTDIVVIGGGVIGLSIAYVLGREGIRTTVLDRRELGREASWAGAGLIPPEGVRPGGHPLGELRSWSSKLYPEWSARLLEETGIDNGYRLTGGVDVAFTDDEELALKTAAGRWRTEGITFERLLPNEFDRVEPALSRDLRVAYFLADRGQIRNPRHLRALAAAVSKQGGLLQPGREVIGFEFADGKVTALHTEEGSIPCGGAIIAAGAWSSSVLKTLGVDAPTPPLKGQIVLLKSDRMLLRRIVEHGKNYLVPRDDGRILVGATEEDAGFDTRTTSLGVRTLLDEAIQLCPCLAEAEVEKAWAGLRPGSIDTRPYIGAVPGFENLFLASGHKRSGLQLSPGTAEVIADLVLGRTPRVDLRDFRPDREPAEAGAGEDAFRS